MHDLTSLEVGAEHSSCGVNRLGVRMKEEQLPITVTVALSRLSPLLLQHTMDHSIPDI